MNKTSRILLRSLLRYSRTNVPKFCQSIDFPELKIFGVNNIYNSQGLKYAILYHFRTKENTPKNIEIAFSALRHLEKLKIIVSKLTPIREANRLASSLPNRIFEVGDVLLHKSGYFRGIFFG